MCKNRWIVDVRGGVIGIYFAPGKLSVCAEHWPEPCLRIDGKRVVAPETGAIVGWHMPHGHIVTAERIAAALNGMGVLPQYEDHAEVLS